MQIAASGKRSSTKPCGEVPRASTPVPGKPLSHSDLRVTELTLDVTSAAQVEAAVEKVGALNILINNAGVGVYDDLGDRAALEQHLAVNLFGTYGVTQSVPAAADSALSGSHRQQSCRSSAFAAVPLLPAYSISKAAAFSLSQSLRAVLAGRTACRVHAVLSGPGRHRHDLEDLDIPKASPESVALSHLRRRGERGGWGIFPDPVSA